MQTSFSKFFTSNQSFSVMVMVKTGGGKGFMIRKIDRWILGKYEQFADFCNDWFSITHRKLERVFIGLYVITACAATELIPPHTHDMWAMVVTFVSGYILYNFSSEPEAVRSVKKGLFAFLRCFALNFAAFSITFGFFRARARGLEMGWIFDSVAQIFYLSVWYLLSINRDGEPGKKRKAALKAIKELFGTSWIVTPEPRPV